jgi:hypothetical protein
MLQNSNTAIWYCKGTHVTGLLTFPDFSSISQAGKNYLAFFLQV